MSILGLLTMPSAAAAVAGFLSIDSCYQQLPQLGCMLLFAWISHYYQLYMISVCLYPVTFPVISFYVFSVCLGLFKTRNEKLKSFACVVLKFPAVFAQPHPSPLDSDNNKTEPGLVLQT